MEQRELKVLMISTDRNILTEQSAVSLRMIEYGSLVGELHIILLSTSKHNLEYKKLGENVFVYPTGSFSRWMYVQSASRLGKKIIFDKKFVRGNSLVTTQDPFECGLVGLKIKNKWRIPLEVQLHTDPFSPYFSGFLNHLRKRIAKKVIRNADAVRVVTKSVADEIVSKLGYERSRINVLPIYVNRELIEFGKATFDLHVKYGKSFLMLMVARLAPEKNIKLALKVLKMVSAQFPDIGLVIVGSGPEEKSLKSYARKLGVDKIVAFEGWQEDLSSYYRTSNVFLQTSYYEGYGLALVEAALSGLPILTTPVGVATEFEHGKDLYICPQGSPEYWAQVVLDLIENNQKREVLKINMKNSIDEKIVSKEKFLSSLKDSWEKGALIDINN